METSHQDTVDFPREAKFVIYKFPGSGATLQKTLMTDEDKNRDTVKAKAPTYAYGCILKDSNYTILNTLYIIDGKIGNIKDLTEKEICFNFSAHEAYNAATAAGVDMYVTTRLGEVLAFDERTMKTI